MRQAERIRYLALAVQREGNRRLAADLAPLGLTPAQSEVLRILGDHAPLTLTAVGSMLVCESGTNPSRLVDKLVDAHLVERRTDSVDRRRVTLTLTPDGRAKEAAVRAVEDHLYAGLDAASAGIDTEALVTFLERLVAGQPAGNALAERIAAEG